MTRRHLTLLAGGKCTDENAARLKLYGQAVRKVKAEPRPEPTPPRAA